MNDHLQWTTTVMSNHWKWTEIHSFQNAHLEQLIILGSLRHEEME